MKEYTTLGSIISNATHPIDTLYQHAPFVLGVAPKSFEVKQNKIFSPSEQVELFASLVGITKKCDSLEAIWIVTTDGKKILPYGVAFVSKMTCMAYFY